jgi:DNA-binding MarR family transcriptional regulator
MADWLHQRCEWAYQVRAPNLLEVATMARSTAGPDDSVSLLRETILGLVRADARDLSARQLAVFLVCYLTEEPQTVRGLAAYLRVSKPAITRALDRLQQDQLVTRKVDLSDRRSVLVGRTTAGNRFLRDVRTIMQKAG